MACSSSATRAARFLFRAQKPGHVRERDDCAKSDEERERCEQVLVINPKPGNAADQADKNRERDEVASGFRGNEEAVEGEFSGRQVDQATSGSRKSRANRGRKRRFCRGKRSLDADAAGRGEIRRRGVSRVASRGRFEENDFRFLVGRRAMFNSVRDDEKFSRAELDRPVAKFHPHRPAPDEKQLVLDFVTVPREDACELHHLHFLTVQPPTIFGRQCSEKAANFSPRFTFSIREEYTARTAVSAARLRPAGGTWLVVRESSRVGLNDPLVSPWLEGALCPWVSPRSESRR